ncbi:MAG TPA: metalloregulator ArsR/SmtB family transcription factor [Myxococcales bacterium]
MRTDALSATFAALADPTRRKILAQLAKGEANVSELSKPFEISQPAISKHLKVLERAGLIVRGRDAQFRPCRLSPAPLEEANDWTVELRRSWEERLDRLGDYLADLQAKEKSHGTKKRRR